MAKLMFVLRATGVVQFIFGALFILAPTAAPALLGLPGGEPAWVTWLFVMMGARFVGYGVGMLTAARDPAGNVAWIDTMIFIQAIDWLATLWALTSGGLTIRNVTTAVVVPPLIIAGLVRWHPRRLAATQGEPAL